MKEMKEMEKKRPNRRVGVKELTKASTRKHEHENE